MRRRTLLSVVGGVCVLAAGWAAWQTQVTPATASPAGQSAVTEKPFVVHEWGTFTTFSGSNGVHLEFRPLLDQDLPGFVMNRARQSGSINPFIDKGRIATRVRMETPVTYFYTDRERTVRASVEFPEGMLTEFYPPVASMSPPYDKLLASGPGEPIGNSRLDWGEVHLIPEESLRPQVSDPQTADWLLKRLAPLALPGTAAAETWGGSPTPPLANHYFRARETDSALVHVRLNAGPPNPNTPKPGPLLTFVPPPTGDFIEKFLFYRGVGKFEAPLVIEWNAKGAMTATNRTQSPLKSLILLDVRGESVRSASLPDLAGGQSAPIPTELKDITIEELRTQMTQHLIAAGLYEKEALAMVNTWNDSWFLEQGQRCFYLVPEDLTNTVIPLQIEPAPDQMCRVMVGRLEMMSPTEEKRLMEVVQANATERARQYAERAESQSEEPVNPPIPKELVDLGRLAEPALVRVRQLSHDETVKNEATTLLWQLQQLFLAEAETASR